MSNEKPRLQVTAIPIETAMSWTTTPFNMYIKLPDGRFVVVFRIGNTVDRERLAKYQAKGVATLYATEYEMVDAISAEVAQAGNDSRIEALNKVSTVVFDELKTMGISEASFNHAKSVSKIVRGLVEKEARLTDGFAKFEAMLPGEAKHSVMTSAISTILCSSMEWIKPATVENVALGALLHDIGKLSLPADIIKANPQALSENNRKIYEGHAEAGRAMLSQVKTIPEDILMIVAHHHERSDGSGYPMKIKDIYIHPLARVVAVANELVERYEADREAGRQSSVRQIVEAVLNASASKFNRDVVKSIRALLNTDALK